MASKRAIYTKRWRERNRIKGLCLCGQPRRQEEPGQPRPKTCERCYEYSQIANGKRIQLGTFKGTAKREDGKVTVALRLEPALIADWQMFCADWAMPLNEALEAAMELYMATTAAHEVQAQSVEDEEYAEYIQIA